jgi:hypothetical protein
VAADVETAVRPGVLVVHDAEEDPAAGWDHFGGGQQGRRRAGEQGARALEASAERGVDFALDERGERPAAGAREGLAGEQIAEIAVDRRVPLGVRLEADARGP